MLSPVNSHNVIGHGSHSSIYPLVNVYRKLWKITMLLMGKSTINWQFSIVNCNKLPEAIPQRSPSGDGQFSVWSMGDLQDPKIWSYVNVPFFRIL